MSTHPSLGPETVDRLRAVLGIDGQPTGEPGEPGGASEQRGAVASAGRSAAGAARKAAKKTVRKAIAWYVDDVAQDRADQAAEKLAAQLAHRDPTELLRTNLELLKGELRALLETVEGLGRAIAPGTGLDGAPSRIAELREGLHALERSVRLLGPGPGPGTGPAVRPAAAVEARAATPAATAAFDYAGFERRFRGDAGSILEALHERYFDLLREHAPVADIGCGRGELLAALGAEGVAAVGVDTDAAMVAEAIDRGVDVHLGDGITWLRDQPEGSLGAVVAIQVLEHLPLEAVLELLELARTRLRPGGVLVAETPNPASLVVLGNSYILDPTHVRPLHPSLMAFLCESAGFRDVELLFWAPATDYQLDPITDPDAPAWVAGVNRAFDKLNRVLFGPQDYAVVATTPPPSDGG